MGTYEFAKRMGATVADTVGIKLRTEILHLKPDDIQPDPDQPRQEFDGEALARLAESLRKFGQLQPVLVRKEGAKYVLISGERRWRAAKLAGMASVQCLACRGGDVRSIQLIENLLREDLKPIEQAKAYRAIIEREGWSARELARQLSIDHTGIAKAMKLLKLPANIQALVDQGDIPPTTAYEIAKRPKGEQQKLAKEAASGRIKGDDLRQKPAPAPAPPPPPHAKPSLVLGASPRAVQPWTFQHGKDEMSVSGPRDKKALVAFLERALVAARNSRQPLLGGLGH